MSAQHARALLFEHGWNTTCFQILNPGIELWFSRDRSAVVGYVARDAVWVVAGAPVCALQDLDDVIAQFESEAARSGASVCYFGAEERVRNFAANSPRYSSVVLGAQPHWTPETFVKAFATDSSLRAQLSRARNKGVRVTEWDLTTAQDCVELRICLEQWLATRGLPPMHFLVEPQTLDDLEGRRIFVAERNSEVIGFTVLSPAPQRNGYLTEQFVRGKDAPNGTVELGLYTAIDALRREGVQYVTMGIVPLSAHGGDNAGNPKWLKVWMAWVRAHGRRFYNFDGLDLFKSKFNPDGWEPIYVISQEREFSTRTLLAIAKAFSDGSVTMMIVRGLMKSVRQELQWAWTRNRKLGRRSA